MSLFEFNPKKFEFCGLSRPYRGFFMVKLNETPVHQDEIWRTQIKSLEFPPGVFHIPENIAFEFRVII